MQTEEVHEKILLSRSMKKGWLECVRSFVKKKEEIFLHAAKREKKKSDENDRTKKNLPHIF